jgi:hypothetical protein
MRENAGMDGPSSNSELIAFLKARLAEDDHEVVFLLSGKPVGAAMLPGSSVDMVDMISAVVDLYAEVQHLEEAAAADSAAAAFAAGRAAGLGEAVRRLALIYHEHPDFRPAWRHQ